jgi:hypothetical protein
MSAHARPLAELLISFLRQNGSKVPVEPPSAWLVEADRLFRIDHREPAEAEALVRWSQADSFWRSNILSMTKFRAQYDQLRLKRAAEQPASLADSPRLKEWAKT